MKGEWWTTGCVKLVISLSRRSANFLTDAVQYYSTVQYSTVQYSTVLHFFKEIDIKFVITFNVRVYQGGNILEFHTMCHVSVFCIYT